MDSLVTKIKKFLTTNNKNDSDIHDNQLFMKNKFYEGMMPYPKQIRYILCQISVNLVTENNSIKIKYPEIQYKKILKIIHLFNREKRVKLLIFVFPELSFPHILFEKFLDELHKFENDFMIFTGFDYIKVNEAKKLIEESNFGKKAKDKVSNYLNHPENQEKILNTSVLIHKSAEKCEYYIFHKISPSKYELSYFGNKLLNGINLNVFCLPNMNFATFVCHDFIAQTPNQPTVENLRKWVDNQFPNFLLTHMFILEMTPIRDDVYRQYELSVSEYYFTSLKARFLNPLSAFTISIFVNSAFNSSFNELFNGEMDLCFGKSNVYFVGTKLDVDLPPRDGYEISPIAPFPELIAEKFDEKEETENDEVKDDAKIARKRVEQYFKEGKGLIQIKIDSNRENILILELLSPRYSGRKRIENIELFELKNGEWKII